MVLQLLSPFDLFQRPILLHFNKNEKNHSNLGLLFSLVIIILMFMQFSTSDIFYHAKPNVVNQDITDHIRKNLIFKNKIFTVSIVDDNSLAYIADPSIFTLVAKNVHMKALPGGGYDYDSVVEKNLHLCNETDFISDPKVFGSLGLKNSYCLDENSFEVYGYWDEPKLAYFEFQVYPCNNATSNIVCKTTEEISNFFLMKYFNLVFADLRLDVQNYTHPLDTKYSNIYQLIEPQLNKMRDIFMKEVEVMTEDGLIFSNINRVIDIFVDSYESDFSFIQKSDEAAAYYTCDFYSSREHQYISRTYLTISEVFANLGGFLSFLMVCGFMLTYIDNTLTLKVQIMNRLYSFQQHYFMRQKNIALSPLLDENKNLADIEKIAYLSEKEKESNKNSPRETQKQTNNLNTDSPFQIKMITNTFTDPNKIKEKIFEPKEKYLEPKEIDEDEPNPEIMSVEHKELEDNDKYIDKNKEIPINSKNITSTKISKNFEKKTFFGSMRRSISPRKRVVNSDFTKFKKFQQLNNNNLKISLCEYLTFMLRSFCACFKKKFKEKLFLKAQERFEYEIDIVNILQRLQDIEKLKKVLMNEKQIALFNLMAKPMIYTEQTENGDGMLNINSTSMRNEDLKDALDYYKEMQANEEVCEIDKRLFKLLDKNINEFKNHF